MPNIANITIYPLKSAAGIDLTEADLTDCGLAHDREWMVVDDNAKFVTQREYSKLALIRPAFLDGALVLHAPGAGQVTLSSDSAGTPIACNLFGETCQAFATSPEIDRWISDYLGTRAAIVARDRSFLRKGGVQYPTRDDRPTTFVDNYGILVISQASLDDLNGRLEQPVPMNRFRPNIVVDGLPPYGEEDATGFASDEIELSFTNVCTRCILPNIDQSTAAVGREPFQTLRRFRFDKAYAGVRFGAYVAVASGIGRTLRVGDELSLKMAA